MVAFTRHGLLSMKITREQVQTLLSTCLSELSQAATEQDIEALRVHYLGRKGSLTGLLRSIKELSAEDKMLIAPLIQNAQREAEAAFTERSHIIADTLLRRATPPCDVTAYRSFPTTGGLHPYSQLIERIEDIFISLGWSLAEGPQIEDDFHNFEALNIPSDHPARDLHDTFWLSTPHYLLRTHTSTVQVRMMEQGNLPLAICAPGRVFRHEATDATHDFTFYQCEGLLLDREVSLAQLLGTLQLFMQQLFCKSDLEIRVRPSYFPFVEPGLEVDVSCLFCTVGCSVCKQTRWIEIGGAGMVHPHVLRACNIDDTIWRGFAFGFGIDRLALLLFRLNDIRLLKTGKLALLQQFAYRIPPQRT